MASPLSGHFLPFLIYNGLFVASAPDDDMAESLQTRRTDCFYSGGSAHEAAAVGGVLQSSH